MKSELREVDLLIEGGQIYSWEGRLVKVDVGVRGDRIVELESAAPHAKRRIDARGLVVAPGFGIHTEPSARSSIANACGTFSRGLTV